jgi:acyl-CoA thioester hydrolase
VSNEVHETTFRVRLKEIAYDHVYFGTFFTWFEVARTELGRAAGMPYKVLVDREIGSFVTSAAARYHRPVAPHAEVRVVTKLTTMSRMRYAFSYEVYADGDDTPSVTGSSHLATADNAGKLCRLPDDFAAAFAPTGDDNPAPKPPGPLDVDFTSDLRVRYEETDAFQIVYYGNYFAWMEAAWSGHLAGTPWDIARGALDGRNIPVIEAACRYLSSARYDDVVITEVGVTPIGKARLRLDYRFRSVDGDTVHALGYSIHAVVDNGRPARITDELLGLLGKTA